MSTLNFVIGILGALCCAPQLYSNGLTISTKDYDYKNIYLIRGQYNFRQDTFIYALCDPGLVPQMKTCSIRLERNVFADTASQRVCDFNITAQNPIAITNEIVDINLWGQDKAILTMRESAVIDAKAGTVIVRAINLKTCKTTIYSLTDTNRGKQKSQIFITPSGINYVVTFYHKRLCEGGFCKVTVNEYGESSVPSPWFDNTDLIIGVEPIYGYVAPLKLVITKADSTDNKVKFCIAGDASNKLVQKFDSIENLMWSTSNGMLAFCIPERCLQINYKGKEISKIKLNSLYQPRKFMALYNVAAGDLLAVVCDNVNLVEDEKYYYRIIRIGTDGRQKQTSGLSIKELKCSDEPNFVQMKFFQNIDSDYCLTVFHSVHVPLPDKRAKFSKYCFSLKEFS